MPPIKLSLANGHRSRQNGRRGLRYSTSRRQGYGNGDQKMDLTFVQRPHGELLQYPFPFRLECTDRLGKRHIRHYELRLIRSDEFLATLVQHSTGLLLSIIPTSQTIASSRPWAYANRRGLCPASVLNFRRLRDGVDHGIGWVESDGRIARVRTLAVYRNLLIGLLLSKLRERWGWSSTFGQNSHLSSRSTLSAVTVAPPPKMAATSFASTSIRKAH